MRRGWLCGTLMPSKATVKSKHLKLIWCIRDGTIDSYLLVSLQFRNRRQRRVERYDQSSKDHISGENCAKHRCRSPLWQRDRCWHIRSPILRIAVVSEFKSRDLYQLSRDAGSVRRLAAWFPRHRGHLQRLPFAARQHYPPAIRGSRRRAPPRIQIHNGRFPGEYRHSRIEFRGC